MRRNGWKDACIDRRMNDWMEEEMKGWMEGRVGGGRKGRMD